MIPEIKTSDHGQSKLYSEINVNGATYNLYIMFYDNEGISIIYSNLFKSLVIQNNIYNPFSTYELLIRNDDNEIEGGFQDKEAEDLAFRFKGNSNENVIIKLEPVIDDSLNIKKHGQDNTYSIEYVCSILDEEEFEDNEHKYKKFTLIDSRYRGLLYTNKQWSTNNLLLKTNTLNTSITQLSDQNRTVYTGDALKDILLEFVNKEIINEDRWDRGNSKIFYSSTTNSSPLETIQHIIDNHISSENNEPCFLRTNTKNKFDFTSISNMYKNIGGGSETVGKDFIGTFKLTLDFEDTTPEFPRNLSNEGIYGIEIPIKQYKFLNFASTDALNKLSPINTINYNFSKKKFTIYKDQGDTHNTIDYYNKILKNIDKKENNKISYIPNTQSKNRTLFNIFYNTHHEDAESVRYEGRNELIKNLLYVSNNIQFTVNGNINLYTGKFLNIKRDLKVDTNFQKKIQGMYFIMSVHHTLSPTEFNTNVIATKPHSIQ